MTFVFSALLEYALVNYASRSDAQRLARRKHQKQYDVDRFVCDPENMEDAVAAAAANNGGGSFAMVSNDHCLLLYYFDENVMHLFCEVYFLVSNIYEILPICINYLLLSMKNQKYIKHIRLFQGVIEHCCFTHTLFCLQLLNYI